MPFGPARLLRWSCSVGKDLGMHDFRVYVLTTVLCVGCAVAPGIEPTPAVDGGTDAGTDSGAESADGGAPLYLPLVVVEHEGLVESDRLLLDALAADCHRYITGLRPKTYGPTMGDGCTEKPPVLSTTHETEDLSGGDMFGLPVPPDGSYDDSVPWNVTFRAHHVDLALDNRASRFPDDLSNNGRPIHQGFLGTFLNVDFTRALAEQTSVLVRFEDMGSVLESGSAARITLGVQILDDQGFNHVLESNLRVDGTWDVCTGEAGPSSQSKGTAIGLAPSERCDPTSAAAVDYRSYNPGVSELTYLNGPALLEPETEGSTVSYRVPVAALYAAYPYKVRGGNPRIVGIYFGIEHHRGARTRLLLRDLRIVDGAATLSQQRAIEGLGEELRAEPPLPPAAVLGIVDMAEPTPEGGLHLRGWACTVGVGGRTEVHVRARHVGETGIGTWVQTLYTDESTGFTNDVCARRGTHAFDAMLEPRAVEPFMGQEVLLVVRSSLDPDDFELIETSHRFP